MSFIVNGYLATNKERGKAKSKVEHLVKYSPTGSSGTLSFKQIILPKELVGKRVRFKMEVVEDETQSSLSA